MRNRLPRLPRCRVITEIREVVKPVAKRIHRKEPEVHDEDDGQGTQDEPHGRNELFTPPRLFHSNQEPCKACRCSHRKDPSEHPDRNARPRKIQRRHSVQDVSRKKSIRIRHLRCRVFRKPCVQPISDRDSRYKERDRPQK